MKTILLMRHGKSSWKESDLADHERPLNKRGLRDAPRMGMILCERELIPQQILSSTAVRARQTAEAVAQASEYTGEVTYLDRLYMAEVEEYIETLRELPDTIERAMIIGHNPGIETLLQVLSGRIESLPTAVIAHIVVPIKHWSELNADINGELVDIWRPKEILALAEEEEQEEEQKKEKSKKQKEKKKPEGSAKKKKK